MIQTKEDLKELFEAGQVQTEAKMVDLIDSCYNDSVMPDAYEVVTTMPTTIPLGKLVLYNGTLWRGLKTGESTLAEGTPFPVVGYKECSFSFYYDGDIVIKVRKNEIKDFILKRVTNGVYIIEDDDFSESANTEVMVNSSSIENVSTTYATTEDDVLICSGLTILIKDSGGTTIDITESHLRAFVVIRKYPPTV